MVNIPFLGNIGKIPGTATPSKVNPMDDVGAPGFAVYGGWVTTKETNANVIGQNRWRTYSDIAVNTSIIAAALRSYFNLIQRTEWSFEPALDVKGESSSDEAKEICDCIEMILNDMDTPFSKVVTKASNYKIYGFSWSEWIGKKRDDGKIGLKDIRIRPQHTIERWEIEENGSEVYGVYQVIPNTGQEVYIPRDKSLYLVDDVISDSPFGTGLLRHCVEPGLKLKEYLRNEAVGIQRDLRGIPVGRIPIDYLNKQVEKGEITKAARDRYISNMRDLVKLQSKSEDTGVLLDSGTYTSKTDSGETISSVYRWGIELLTGVGTSGAIGDTGAAIDRLNREIARILGAEHLMLGDGSGGNRALSEDKSRNFFLQIEGAIADIAAAVEKDIIDQIMLLNGFNPELKPTIGYEAVQFKDVGRITAALRDMSTAGAVMAPDDPAIDEVRALLGLSPQPEDIFLEDERQRMRTPDDDPDSDPIDDSDDDIEELNDEDEGEV